GVGGHLRLQLAAGIVDRNPYFERGHVIFLHAHRGDLRHLAVEALFLEWFHFDPRRLAQINLADVALIHLAFYVHLAGITESHHQGGGGSQHKDGTNGIAHFHIARERNSINRRHYIGVTELLLKLLQIGAITHHLSF